MLLLSYKIHRFTIVMFFEILWLLDPLVLVTVSTCLIKITGKQHTSNETSVIPDFIKNTYTKVKFAIQCYIGTGLPIINYSDRTDHSSQ